MRQVLPEKRAARTTAELWSEPVLSNLFYEIAAPCGESSRYAPLLDNHDKRVSLAWVGFNLGVNQQDD